MNLGFGLNINDTAQESGYDQYKSSLFESLGAVAADNWNFNPGSSLVLWSQKIDAQIQSTKQNLERVNRQNLNKEYAKIGLFFEEDEYQSVVDIMVKEKKEERARQSIMERGPKGSWNPLNKGFYVGAAKLTTGLAVSMVDPINIAASFIPVFGQARFARLVAKKSMTFTKARAIRGAVEGVAGAAIVEPLVYGVAQSVQADYDLYDSFLNIGFGAVMGSGLHVGAGKLKDANTRRKWNNRITEGKKILGDNSEAKVDINFYREYYPETSEIMRDLEASDPRTRLALLRKAMGDQIFDNPTDVTHVANGDPVLRDSPDAKPNPDVNARPKTSLDEMELNNLEQTVVNKNTAEQIADNDILQSQLDDLQNKQKDLDLTFSNDDAAVKVASDEFNEVNTRSKDLDAIIKDAINCVNGR
jgi:hypothetical protein